VSAFFLTGTGTDVGKTFVAAGLIRHLRRAGRTVEALKPVVSGFDPAFAADSDPGRLLIALGRSITPDQIDRIAPWRFAAPLSPDMAARGEGRAIDFEALVEFSRTAVAGHTDIVLIEGVGGIMVPLDDRHTVLDWMCALRLPLLLVGGSYLGSISHTLTCIDVLRSRELGVAALVVSETPGSTVALEDTIATVARFAGGVRMISLPRLVPDAFEHPAFAQLTDLLMALGNKD
jgi:dethiobiotin synthetase